MLNKYCLWLILIGVLNLTLCTVQLNDFTIEIEYCEQIDAENFQSIDFTENVLSNEFTVLSSSHFPASESIFPEIQMYMALKDFTVDTPPPNLM